MRRSDHIKIGLLIILGVAHVLATLFVAVPGRLSIDEEIQHWMARSFAEERTLALWNGYGEFPSRELTYSPFIQPHEDKLYPIFPYLFPVLTGPLYGAMGLRGFYVLNALAFAGTVLLCFLTATLLFRDTSLALDSCIILVLATFAWEYSHAVWPHATASLFVAGAVCLAASALVAETRRGARIAALAAGFVAGFGCGTRVDVALVFPALTLPFLFMRPSRPVEAVMVLAGAIPGLAILAFTNLIKFGVWGPFSYGPVWPSAPNKVLIGVAALTGVLWLVTRLRSTATVQGRKWLLWASLIAVCVPLFIVPETRAFIIRVLRYTYISLIDIRGLDAATEFASMTRTPGGGVVYGSALKKAVLQNMPFLPLLLVPAIALARNDRNSRGLWLLFLVPLIVTGYAAYEFPNREGAGLTYNYRYFVAALPSVAILCAFALRRLRIVWPIHLTLPMVALTTALTAVAFAWLVFSPGSTVIDQEFPLLVLPLVFAAMLLVLIAGSLAFEVFRTPSVQTAGQIVITAAFVWAGLTAYSYDYVHHRKIRQLDHAVGRMILTEVPDNSILFASPRYTPFSNVLHREKVRLAGPELDGFRDFPRLVEFNLRAGRRVFGYFDTPVWMKLIEQPLLPYTVRPVMLMRQGFLGEITATTEAATPVR